jgi:hypothetical protein
MSWLNTLEIELAIAFMLISMDRESRTPFEILDTIDESEIHPTVSEAVLEKLNMLRL